MSPRCTQHRRLTVPPIDLEEVDGVMSVMADLPDGTVVFIGPDSPGRARVGTGALRADPRCTGAAMFGLRAPSDAALVGLCFSGRPTTDTVADRRRVDVVVTAAGVIRAMAHDDGVRTPTAGEPSGVVVDALHRMLALPVPGGPPPLTDLVVGLWMAGIRSLVESSPSPTWAEIASLHPSAPGTGAAAAADPPTPAAVAASTCGLAADATWADLHHAAAIGRMTAPELDAAEAAWMDTTMFARWMVDSFPATRDVLQHLRRCGSDAAARCVEVVLERLDP